LADARITGVRLLRLDPYGDGDPAGTWNLIRVDTDQGVWGLGEAYWGTGLRPVIDDLLAPQLVGGNPSMSTAWSPCSRRGGPARTPGTVW